MYGTRVHVAQEINLFKKITLIHIYGVWYLHQVLVRSFVKLARIKPNKFVISINIQQGEYIT